MLGIYIDVADRQLSYIYVPDTKVVPTLIGNGCDLFCCPFELKNGDVLYADNEATLRQNNIGAFILPNMPKPIAGNAILLGSDAEGYIADSRSKIQEIEKKLVFVDARFVKNDSVLNSPNDLVIQ